MALDGCSQEGVRVGVWRKVKRRLLVQQVGVLELPHPSHAVVAGRVQ